MTGTAVACLLLAASALGADDFVIAERGKAPDLPIAVRSPSAPSAGLAARELADYVRQLTGVELPVVTNAAPNGRAVCLSVVDDAKLGPDGFRLKVEGGRLSVTGGKRGVLYGVYEILETFGGVNWWTSWHREVPRLDRFAVPRTLDDVQVPAFAVRQPTWKDNRVPHAGRYWRLNSPSQHLTEEEGGDDFRFVQGLPNCHTTLLMVPPERYFRDHPEYFSEIGGSRRDGQTQLCLTNPDVLELVVSNVLERIAKDPKGRYYGVAQMDWANYCECPRCKAVDDEEESHMGTQLRFVNAVAERVGKVWPDKICETIAYQYTQKAPKFVRPRKNVMICLAAVHRDCSKSYAESRFPENAAFMRDLAAWSRLTDNLYIWDYETNFNHYLMPFANLLALQADFRILRDHGARHVYAQGAYQGWHGEMAELKNYVVSKWLWNPDLDRDALVAKFLSGYYGAAAPHVREYLDRLHALPRDEAKAPLLIFQLPGDEKVVSAEFLDWALDVWDRAEDAVRDDPVRSYNVRMSALPVAYWRALGGKGISLRKGAEDGRRKALAKRVLAGLAEAEAAGRPIRLAEGQNAADSTLHALKAMAEGRQGRLLADGGRVFDVRFLSLGHGDRYQKLVPDAAGEGGVAVNLYNTSCSWYTTWKLAALDFEPGRRYRLRIRARAALTGVAGEVFSFGVHDSAGNRAQVSRSVASAEIGSDYAWYDAGVWTPGENDLLWIMGGRFDRAKTNRSPVHDGVWIGGIEITPETGIRSETAPDAPTGRLWRADDQMRFLWATTDQILPDLVRQGFNTIITCTGVAYDMEKDAPVADFERFCAKRRKRLDFIGSLGLTLFEQPPYAHNAAMARRFQRVNRDGSEAKRKNNPDAANAEYQAIVRRAFETEARSIAGHPAVYGLQTSSEVRDMSQLSFTEKTAADWKACSGTDIPEYADKGPWPRVPPNWKLLVAKGQMDPGRIVPDDYPLLRFFRWVWQSGDGWNDYQKIAAEAFNGAFPRRVKTQYDPILRTPASRASVPDVDYCGHWEYTVPDPYSVCYIVSEEQSRVRGTGRSIMTMIQAIVYRSTVAPKGEHPANEPAWTKEFPNTSYPTMPADILQEAIWSAFARRTDAIGFHGWCALYDGMIANLRHDLDRYQCADPTAIRTIGRLFHEVGEPLGPLFKALPERPMEVAVLESDTAQFFNDTLWSSSLAGPKTAFGNLAVMANLNPQTLLEEEIAADGVPASVKVLLMPGCDVLTESGVRAVRAFQARGGRILADTRLVPSIRPDGLVKTVEAAWKEKASDHDDGVADPAKDATVRIRMVQEAAARLKADAGLVPFADTDNPSVFTWTRSCGSADYVFAINDRRTFGDYVGPWKRVCEKGEPASATVIVNRPAGAVYDLVRHAPVPFSVEGGKTRIKVDYTTNDGRVFLIVAVPLKPLDVRCADGRLVVTSPDRDVMIPIRVQAGEKTFSGVVRDGRYETPVAAAPVRVVNLATGEEFAMKGAK